MQNTVKYIAIFLLVALLSGGAQISFAQNQERVIDSLANGLKIAKEDTDEVNILNALSGIYRKTDDFKIALKYANDALALAERINYKKGIVYWWLKIGVFFGNASWGEEVGN